MRTLIANGTIVTADGSYEADVLVDGETIAQIGTGLAGSGTTADETIDAAGRYVIPGAIDVHTHMELPFGGTFAKDTFETGTRAAAFGGTTCVVDFAVQSKGQSLRAGLDAWHAKAEGNAVVDYGFHMIMSDVTDDSLAEMDQLVAEGIPDFKLFTAYPGVFYSDDAAIFRAMQQTAKNGGLIMMHAENGPAIDVVAAQLVAEGKTDPYYHGVARYPIFEGEATNRVIRLAEAAGVPVYIVHLSATRGARGGPRRPRPGRPGLRRDLPAVPVPEPRRPRQRVRGVQVRLLAAAAAEGPALGAALGRPAQGRPAGGLDRPLPVRLPRPEGARSRRLPEDPQRPAGRRGPGGPAARRRRRRRTDLARALGGRDLHGAGQAVRHVPAQGRHRGRLGRGPRGLRPQPPAHDLGRDAPHGRRLLVLRGPPGPGRVRRGPEPRVGGGPHGEFTGSKGYGRFVKRATADYARLA